MNTFLLIIIGLVAFNFLLLKFSMQSVDTKKKKAQSKKKINQISGKSEEKAKNSEIPTAA